MIRSQLDMFEQRVREVNRIYDGLLAEVGTKRERVRSVERQLGEVNKEIAQLKRQNKTVPTNMNP